MRIVLDAMGSDTHPGPEAHAALEAYKLWGDPILLVGPEAELEALIADIGGDPNAVEIVHAPEVLKMTDKPAKTARGKAETSMAVGRPPQRGKSRCVRHRRQHRRRNGKCSIPARPDPWG